MRFILEDSSAQKRRGKLEIVTARKNISSVVLWSVISAAFIGPGTVTTAASAGALFQLNLLWAVVFSTIACIILQEVSARLTIVSGLTMGQALTRKHGDRRGRILNFLLGGPVILGCAAYEAGNILGGVSGLTLFVPIDATLITLILSLIVLIVLWTDRRQAIGWIMTFLVGIMGIAFFALASGRPFSAAEYFQASIVPQIPSGSELLTLGLVGTTIVPYNIFLGSGVSKGQTVQLMRIGLTISVIIGGLITAAILIAGTAVGPFTNFAQLAQALNDNLGSIGSIALGVGLFAAGFSSAITSPYAASIIASSVFSWGTKGQRWVWGGVLFTGFAFGISGIKPIPVILMVQALNGLVLPLVTAFLILLINDQTIIPRERRPGNFYNTILVLIFGSVLFMGLHSVDKSFTAWLGLSGSHYELMAIATLALTGYLTYSLIRLKRMPSKD